MRTFGIFIAIAGAGIIVLHVLYQVLKAIVTIPFVVKAGLGLVLVGGIIVIASLVRERGADRKKETFLRESSDKETES